MPRTCLVVATLVVGLLITAACGGSAGSAPDEKAEDARLGTTTISSMAIATAPTPSTEPTATDTSQTDAAPAATSTTTTTTEPPTTTTTTTSPPTTTTTTTTEPPPPEPDPPTVVVFEVSPVTLAPHEEATVQWEVEGAAAVELVLPDGHSVSIEPKGSRAAALPVGSHTYELRAANKDGMTVTRTQRVDVVEPRGEWQFNSFTDALTGDRSQGLAVFSDNSGLLIVCERGSWKAATIWGDQYIVAGPGRSVAVAYRIDDGEVIERTESRGVDPDFVFVNDVKPFVSSLLGKDTLIYRVWNYDGSEVGTATFPIAHLEYRIDELRDCSL